MPLRIGILGLGVMGKCHFDAYKKVSGAQVVAFCDTDPAKRAGEWTKTAFNLGEAGTEAQTTPLKVYASAEELFADPGVDVVDITLPTFLHAPNTIAALNAGKHVICEKPMARTSAEAQTMIAAAKRARRQLYIAQCIRFWPAYAKARELVKSGALGKVRSATFRRIGGVPQWSWQNWMRDPAKSGGSLLDLHVHDADFVLYCFGAPKSVTSYQTPSKQCCVDHIITHYDYTGGKFVEAEGAWFHPGFPFSMNFVIVMDRATLLLTPKLELMVCPAEGETRTEPLPEGDGYVHELRHFVECIAQDKPSAIVPPKAAAQSVRLVELELESARTGKKVAVKL